MAVFPVSLSVGTCSQKAVSYLALKKELLSCCFVGLLPYFPQYLNRKLAKPQVLPYQGYWVTQQEGHLWLLWYLWQPDRVQDSGFSCAGQGRTNKSAENSQQQEACHQTFDVSSDSDPSPEKQVTFSRPLSSYLVNLHDSLDAEPLPLLQSCKP